MDQVTQRNGQAVGQRTVLLHYHLFKNAGTSLDALLKEAFPGMWVTREFPGSPDANQQMVKDWITQTPDAVCFSSHTAQLPPPDVAGINVIPLIFVRHPLDRIASVYSFERRQNDPGFGSTLARNTTLRGYIETRNSIPGDRMCRDFHVDRFARMFPGASDDQLGRALKALEMLPFVGVVELFDESLARLQSILEKAGFSDLDLRPVRHNVSQGRSASLEERLRLLEEEIGSDFYKELCRANEHDLSFYSAAFEAASQRVR